MDSIFAKDKIRVTIVGRNLDELEPMLKMFPCELVDDNPDLVISYGGDGSLLGAERSFPGVPKCPLRDRKNNPKCPKHSELSTLTRLFAGELKKIELVKLQAVTEDGESIQGINEILVDRTRDTVAIRYRLWIDGQLFRPQVVADSLLVATPFGSTGYFQSITHGNFQSGLGLAFNNSMDLLSYSIIKENSKVTVQILRGPAYVGADNDPRKIELETNRNLTIQAIPEKTVLYGLDVFRCPDCYDLRKHGYQ